MKTLIKGGLFAGLGFGLLYTFQTKLIFYPQTLPQDYIFQNPWQAMEVFIKTSDNQSINGLYYHKPKSNAIILYFHGNAGDLSSWQYVYEDFAALPDSFLIIDYRGFGKSGGTISEEGLYIDALASYDYVLSLGYKPDQITLYGRSIGTGVAIDLATKRICRALALESPFISMKKLAMEKVPYLLPFLFLKYHFNNIHKLSNLAQQDIPILFLHGDKDELIPAYHSKILFESYTGTKTLQIIAGAGHNDLSDFSDYHSGLAQFLLPIR